MYFAGKAFAVSSIVFAGWFGSDDPGTKDEFDECVYKNNLETSEHKTYKNVWKQCIAKHQKSVELDTKTVLTVNGHPVSSANTAGVERYFLKITIQNLSDTTYVTSLKAHFDISDGGGVIKIFDNLMLLHEYKDISIPIDYEGYLKIIHVLELQNHKSFKAVISDVKGLDIDD